MSIQGDKIRVDGCVVFWSLSEWSRLSTLHDGLKDIGKSAFAPEPRTPAAAIHDALKKTFPDHLIQPLKKRDAYEVRTIERGDDENEYRMLHTIALREENGTIKIAISPFDREIGNRLASSFNDYLGMVRCSQVTQTLTGVISSLGGTTLRPRGSIYWLPGRVMDEWNAVAEVAERAAIRQSSKCYIIKHQMDGDALRAVRDAIIAEVESEVLRIETEIQSGELGDRALENRKNQANDLHDKVKLYEELLRTGLPQLHEALDRTESSAAQAALMGVVAGAVN